MYAAERQSLYFPNGFWLITVTSSPLEDWPELSSQDAYFIENTDEKNLRSADCPYMTEIDL